MNPEVLPSVGLDIKKEIMDLAQIWELPNYPNIPKFRETKDLDKAHVRVQVTSKAFIVLTKFHVNIVSMFLFVGLFYTHTRT